MAHRRGLDLLRHGHRLVKSNQAQAGSRFGQSRYRSRQTLSFCKEHGIRLSGSALGKPPKNQNLTRQLKNQEYHDSCDRNAVEGTFGTGKTSYGLGRISVRLKETTCCVIGVALLLMNLLRSPPLLTALFPPPHLSSLAASFPLWPQLI